MTRTSPISTERLFFALWPDDDTRARCARAGIELESTSGARVVPDNLHITLSFLGFVDAQKRNCAEAAGDAVRVAPFTLTLDHVGYFAKPKVAWLGARALPEQLLTLADDLTARSAACGIVLDSRPFAAHMTLIRKMNGAPLPLRFAPIVWRVTSFSLVKSETRASGALYSVLRTWPLD